MTYAAYIRVTQAVVDRFGRGEDGRSAWPGQDRRVYNDRLVKIIHRTQPKELVLKSGPEIVLHLYGSNLLHFDENKVVFEHLVKLLPGDGALLDVMVSGI